MHSMKKLVIDTCLILALATGCAGAEEIKGKIGITGRLGFLNPASSEVISGGNLVHVGTDVGWYGGGGFIYGIQNYLTADMEVTHTSFDGDAGSEGSVTDISFGVQYRFPERNRFIPYAGAGFDILVNDFSSPGHNYDVDPAVGVHAKGGVDYFLTKELALNAEAKALFAPTADIDEGRAKKGNFDASGFSGSLGIRYFFY
jgi:outer membrane protein